MSAGKLTEAEWSAIYATLPERPEEAEGWELSLVRRTCERVLAEREANLRAQIAADIEAKYLGPDFGRQCDGRESPTASLQNAYDEGLEVATRIARGGDGA